MEENEYLNELVDILESDTTVSTDLTPLRKRRRGRLSYSEVKRRKKKDDHCKYCDAMKSKDLLELHLTHFKNCRHCYFSEYGVVTIDALLLKLFPCLFCEEGGQPQFKRHMESSVECFRSYCDKWDCTSIR